MTSLRVCYFGTYRDEYSRNRVLIEGLRRAGAGVVECHVPLWHGIEDRVQAASGGWLRPAFLARMLRAWGCLLRAHRAAGNYDVMILGYPGVLDAPLARLLTWRRRRPLVLDSFMSIYLIALERGLVVRHPLTGRLIYASEWLACRLADRLIQDTPQYRQWLCATYGLDTGRVRLVPTGADDRIFHPLEPSPGCARSLHESTPFLVFYHGSFIPNHSVGTIVEAARLLRDEPDLQFELVGDGPDRPEAEARVRDWGLANVSFPGWLEPSALVQRAARASLCLGAFGTTPQSVMTVHNKIYECLAMRRPVLTGDSPAVRDAFKHGVHVWLCPRADPPALAQAILTLKGDPALRESLAENGHRLFLERYTVEALGQQLHAHLEELAR